MSATSVTEVILHCQKQIKKNRGEEKLLHYLARLKRLRIQVKDLVETGIGRTVNQLSRLDGLIGQEAGNLVNDWKALVEEAEMAEKSPSEASEEASSHEEEDDENEPDDEGALHIMDNDKDDSDDSEDLDGPVYQSAPMAMECERGDTINIKKESMPMGIECERRDTINIKKEKESVPMAVDCERRDVVSIKKEKESVPVAVERERKDVVNIKKEKEHNGHSHHVVNIKKEHNGHSHHHHEEERHRRKDKEHRHKRKSEDELSKPETDIKKVKLEPKTEKLKKPPLVPTLSVEIDSTSGVNFADVLSCLDQKLSHSSPKKKDKSRTNGNLSKSSKDKSSSSSHGSSSHSSHSSSSKRTAHEDKRKSSLQSSKDKDKETLKKSKTKSVILPSSPASVISPNYKPSAVARIMAVSPMPKPSLALPPKDIYNSLRSDFKGISGYPVNDGESRENTRRTTEDAFSTMISSRNQRTKVYSGVKTGYVGAVPKLFDLCIRTIQQNINDLGYTGGVPYDILKPVLEKASVDQLFHLENYNPYLIESTDELWRFHCGKDFRTAKPEELESWRELYMRCVDQRKARFQLLTNKVKNNQEMATPQMKTKLAYVDTTAGPRFSKTKAATIKSGMKSLKTREEKGVKRAHGSSASAGGSGSSQNIAIEEASVIISTNSRAGSAPAPSRERESTAAAKKPKKAPLMQKTLKVIKTLFRR